MTKNTRSGGVMVMTTLAIHDGDEERVEHHSPKVDAIPRGHVVAEVPRRQKSGRIGTSAGVCVLMMTDRITGAPTIRIVRTIRTCRIALWYVFSVMIQTPCCKVWQRRRSVRGGEADNRIKHETGNTAFDYARGNHKLKDTDVLQKLRPAQN
jgi:hypothetical protein